MTHNEIASIQALKQLQDDFYKAIFHPDSENIKKASRYILGTNLLTEVDRLTIYRDSILGGITTGLSAIYPVCVKLVGDEFFTHMVAGYLKEYPSESPDLGNYGGYLPSYISQFKPAEELVYLPGVAQLEWLWHKAFNALDERSLSSGKKSPEWHALQELESISEDRFSEIKFKLTSSVGLLCSDYPVHRVWLVNQSDYEGDQAVDLNEGCVKLVIWRSADYSMRVDELSDDEFQFISALLEGLTFGEIAEMTFSKSLGEILQRCIQAGLIIGFLL